MIRLDSQPRGHGFESCSFRCDKRKAYIGGWIYPEYSLARACSVFRSRCHCVVSSVSKVKSNEKTHCYYARVVAMPFYGVYPKRAFRD